MDRALLGIVLGLLPSAAFATVGCRPATKPVTLVAGPAPAASPSADTVVDSRGPASPHPDAIGRLLEAPWAARLDKRRTLSLPLPDGGAWTHVRYWGVTTLAGYRYGDEHHVALAAFTFAPPAGGATVDGCATRFVEWGRARAKQFDVEVGEPRIEEVAWPGAPGPAGAAAKARVYVLDARRRSILGTKTYAAAFAIYPAWAEACLAVGFAVPERDAKEAARALRDRMVSETLPGLVVKAGAGALALEARTDGA